ncbi:MAG: 4-(cytidine 5'-diphospho)-2-C-methyl-D-erythritol kinase [Candidatus Aegiribacteria sp.]|nr:4-(cytidine 5'-diphospho)-2-C-methyl-D-erythritol kinase [Candidatus Aegiribacteria sp.]
MRILNSRSDGFHDIRSLFQEISLHDTVHIIAKPGNGNISLTCKDYRVPSDSSNLAWKAAARFLSLSEENLDIEIDLVKRIPSEAGLGGGSSDAAAVLLGLRTLTARPTLDLSGAASALGSDVPFFLHGGTALIEGRGERIIPVPSVPFHAVLLHPSVTVSTAWAYNAWDGMRTSLTNNGILKHYSASSAVWHEGKIFPHNLWNDFLPLLEKHFPEIEELARFLRNSCENWGLSGSGPTFYALFRMKSEAVSFSQILTGNYTLCRSAETAGASSNG